MSSRYIDETNLEKMNMDLLSSLGYRSVLGKKP